MAFSHGFGHPAPVRGLARADSKIRAVGRVLGDFTPSLASVVAALALAGHGSFVCAPAPCGRQVIHR